MMLLVHFLVCSPEVMVFVGTQYRCQQQRCSQRLL